MATPEEVKHIHRLEQMSAALREGAMVTYKYFQTLINAGFTEEQALTLVNSFQTEFWAYAMAKGGLDADDKAGSGTQSADDC